MTLYPYDTIVQKNGTINQDAAAATDVERRHALGPTSSPPPQLQLDIRVVRVYIWQGQGELRLVNYVYNMHHYYNIKIPAGKDVHV